MKWAVGITLSAITLIPLFLLVGTRSHNAFGPNLAHCMQGQDRQGCLRTALPQILKQTSAAAILNYTVASSSEPSVVANCHLIAHAVGEAVYLKSSSLEETLTQCTNACSYGCFHGAIASAIATTFGESYLSEDIAHADTTQLETEGTKYCADPILCHGMGHVARIATSSLSGALATCDAIAHGNNAAACYGGVFMEDSGNVTFVKRSQSRSEDDYGYPCNTVDAKQSHACYMQLYDYQYPLFQKSNVRGTEQEVIQVRVCSALTEKRRADCFYGIGYKQDRVPDASGKPMHHGPTLCASLAPTDRTSCMLGLSRNYASFSRVADAITYCDSQSVAKDKANCFDELFTFVGAAHSSIPALCIQNNSTSCTDGYKHFKSSNQAAPTHESD